MSDPKSETEEVERLAVVMVTRHDQIKLLDKLTALEKKVNELAKRLRDWEDVVRLSNRPSARKRRDHPRAGRRK